MSLRVTVLDEQTGDSETMTIDEGDYVLVCAAPCYEDSVQTYANGQTHVITVKGRKPRSMVADVLARVDRLDG